MMKNPVKKPLELKSKPKPTSNVPPAAVAATKMSQQPPVKDVELKPKPKPTSNIAPVTVAVMQQTQQPTVKNVERIKMKFSNPNLFDSQMKSLLLRIKEANGASIDLSMITEFDSDKQLLDFSVQFGKFAPGIRYLSWDISGKFTDDGQARTIGLCLSRLANLYKLNLSIKSPFFADTGAISLGSGLAKLKNLHILILYVQTSSFRIVKQMTQQGKIAINKGINQIPFLEEVECDLFKVLPTLASKTLATFNYSFYDETNCWIKPLEFSKLIYTKRDFITQIGFNSSYRYFSKEQESYEEDEDEDKANDVYSKVFLVCFTLPYLTSFINCRVFEDDSQAYLLKDLLSIVTNEKMRGIMALSAFYKNIAPILAVNPRLVALDLLF